MKCGLAPAGAFKLVCRTVTGSSPLVNPPWWRLALVSIGALALATGIGVIDALPVGVFHDDAMYVILARSIASGQGYRYLNIPGAPAATQHPPGYPALLALVSWIAPAFPANITAFKALNAIIGAASAVLVTGFARRALDPGWAVCLGIVASVSIPTLVLGNMLLSEPLFLLVVIGLLISIESFAEQPGTRRRALLVGAGIAVCALVRSNGIVLLPATLIALGLRRRWRDAGLVAFATVVVMLPWQFLLATHTGVLPLPLRGDYESSSSWWMRGLHADGPGMLLTTLGKTIPEAIGMLAVLFSPVGGQPWHAVTIVALLALTIAGIAGTWRRIPVTLLFLAGYLTIVVIWPFPPARFIWAVWPLLLLVIVAGANSTARRIQRQAAEPHDGQRPARRFGLLALLCAFGWAAAGYTVYEVHGVRGKWWGSVSRANAGRIAATVTWVNANTSSGDLVASEDEGAVFLYTGRRTVPVLSLTTEAYLRDIPAPESARDGLQPILGAYPVSVVVVGTQKTVETADFLVAAKPPLLRPGTEFAGVVAYRVLHPR